MITAILMAAQVAAGNVPVSNLWSVSIVCPGGDGLCAAAPEGRVPKGPWPTEADCKSAVAFAQQGWQVSWGVMTCEQASAGDLQTLADDSGQYIPMNVDVRLRLAFPPCGTAEALKAKGCIKWVADPDDPQAIGHVPSVVQIGLPDSRP